MWLKCWTVLNICYLKIIIQSVHNLMMQMLVIRLHRPLWLAVTSLIDRSAQRGWKNGKGNVSLCLYFVVAQFLVVFQRHLKGFLGPWQNTVAGRSFFLPLFLVLPPIYISKHSNSWITIKNWKLRWQRKITSLIKIIQFRVLQGQGMIFQPAIFCLPM